MFLTFSLLENIQAQHYLWCEEILRGGFKPTHGPQVTSVTLSKKTLPFPSER